MVSNSEHDAGQKGMRRLFAAFLRAGLDDGNATLTMNRVGPGAFEFALNGATVTDDRKSEEPQ